MNDTKATNKIKDIVEAGCYALWLSDDTSALPAPAEKYPPSSVCNGQNAGQRPEILKGWHTRRIPSTPPHIEAPDVPAAGTLGTGRAIILLKKTLGRPVWETLLCAAPGIAITFRLGKAEL